MLLAVGYDHRPIKRPAIRLYGRLAEIHYDLWRQKNVFGSNLINMFSVMNWGDCITFIVQRVPPIPENVYGS